MDEKPGKPESPEPQKEVPPPAFEERGRDQSDEGEEDLSKDPAYEPEGPLKGIKGG